MAELLCTKIPPNEVLLAHPNIGVVVRRAHVSQLKDCFVMLC